jgi:hypothetical protein
MKILRPILCECLCLGASQEGPLAKSIQLAAVELIELLAI